MSNWKKVEEGLPKEDCEVFLRIYKESDKEVFYRKGYFSSALNEFVYYVGNYDFSYTQKNNFYEDNKFFENRKLTHYEIITEPKETK